MTIKELDKIIRAKKEFKDGDFFKMVDKGKTLVIGCFKSIDSEYINCHFLYFVNGEAIDSEYTHTNCALKLRLRLDIDTRDLFKASPLEAMFVVDKVKNSGWYYDRRARKVKNIDLIDK